MVLTSKFINLIRSIDHLNNNVVMESRANKPTLAKIFWLKEFFKENILDTESALLTSQLSYLVIQCVDWERVIHVFEHGEIK